MTKPSKFYQAVTMAGDQYRADLAAAMQLASVLESIPEPDFSILPTGLVFNEDENAEWVTLLRQLGDTLANAAATSRRGTAAEPSMGIHIPGGTVGAAFNRYFYEVIDKVKMPSPVSLIQRSVLTLVVSSFESLLAKLVAGMLHENPDLVPRDESTLTLAQIESFSAIEDARTFVVDRKVDDFMRKSLRDWCAWFGKSGIEWTTLTDNWGELVEVLARRNVFMHADGRASGQYVDLLKWAGVAEDALPHPGSELQLTVDYLEDAHSRLFAMGVLLCGSLVINLKKADAEFAIQWTLGVAKRAIDRGDYLAGEIVTSVILRNGRRKNSQRIMVEFQALNWLCRLQLGYPGAAEEIRAWDTTVLAPEFAHWKPVMLEEDDDAIKLIEQLVRSGKLSRVDVQFGSMYSGLRERRPEEAGLLYNRNGVNSLTREEVLRSAGGGRGE
jgi:hypothetical protein